MTNLSELLERVKAATGPDRGLDGLIARDLERWTPHFALDGNDLLDWPVMGGHWHLPDDPEAKDCRHATASEPPEYTASIDAALALSEQVLPGWAAGFDAGPKTRLAFVDRHDYADRIFGARFTAEAPSICLAILAATLSALIAQAKP